MVIMQYKMFEGQWQPSNTGYEAIKRKYRFVITVFYYFLKRNKNYH